MLVYPSRVVNCIEGALADAGAVRRYSFDDYAHAATAAAESGVEKASGASLRVADEHAPILTDRYDPVRSRSRIHSDK